MYFLGKHFNIRAKNGWKSILAIESKKICVIGALIFAFLGVSVASAINVSIWYDDNAQKQIAVPMNITLGESVWSNGELEVTSSISGIINPQTGATNIDDTITLKNLTSDKIISFNSVTARLNSGFEGQNIANWTIKNTNNTLFNGTAGTIYSTDVELKENQTKTFNVTTSLTGEGAGKFVNKTPFNFVYNYNAEKPGFTATIDTTDGFVKSETPSDWTKTSNTTYTKKFPDSTAYSVILAEWDGATFEHSSEPETYSFGGFSPSSGTLTADTTFSAQWSAYLYKVCVWGIQEDQYDSNESHKVNLTFGPAIGASKDCLEHDGGHTHCIHNESWETIIANCNAGHGDWYSDCLNDGCTKAVPINMNTTLGKKSTTKVECSTLQNSNYINSTYRYWNKTYDSSDYESANYATSRLRSTMIGSDRMASLSTYAGTDCLDSTNCLLSCFPKVLQDNIKPKFMEVATSWETSSSTTPPYKINTSTFIADKLWIMNANENYTTPYSYLSDYRSQYTKAQKMGITTSAYSNNIVFNELGSSSVRWLRSPSRNKRCGAGFVLTSGALYDLIVYYSYGLSPCFCL